MQDDSKQNDSKQYPFFQPGAAKTLCAELKEAKSLTQEQFDTEEARKLQKKIAKNQFNFNDFLSQINQIKKMGNLKELASMIPGVSKAIKDVDFDDDAFKGIEAIILSMTPDERENPVILNGSRRRRIAVGSGTSITDVNRLIKQFDETRKVMKMMTGGKKMSRVMNNMPFMRRK